MVYKKFEGKCPYNFCNLQCPRDEVICSPSFVTLFSNLSYYLTHMYQTMENLEWFCFKQIQRMLEFL